AAGEAAGGRAHAGPHRYRDGPRRRLDDPGRDRVMRRAPSTPPDLPGYTALQLLGSGGFADVFLYEQRLPRRKVAVKVLLTEELGRDTRAQFVAEANLMAQLSAHPFIVTIFHA